MPAHLKNIQCNANITIQDVVNSSSDLYGLEEFFDNYTQCEVAYDIVCVKYETVFDSFANLDAALNIPSRSDAWPTRKETIRAHPRANALSAIYAGLIAKIESMPPIHVVRACSQNKTATHL